VEKKIVVRGFFEILDKECGYTTIAQEYESVIYITAPEFIFMYPSSVSLIAYADSSAPASPEGEGG
jgi:hypothetical protein